MVEIRKTKLDGVVEIIVKKFGDDRGFFSEVYNEKAFKEAGITADFVQDNHAYSAKKGVFRGLHYQLNPSPQGKLVRVTRGRVFDVAVDIRRGSPTFKQWVGIELSADKWNQFYIPPGFAHGYLTLEDNCEFLYKVTNFYAPECDRSIKFDDPEIGIEWPVALKELTLSEKDKNAPLLKDADLFDIQEFRS